MTTHHLKIQRQSFADLVSGRKTGEVRNCADREFREGDQVELFLMDETGNPANKSIVRTITHIQRGYGLPDDICVLSYAATIVETGGIAEAVERKPDAIIEGVMTSVGISHAIYASTVSLKHGEQVKLYASPPAPVSVELDDGDLIEIARDAALASTHRYSYMPARREDAHNWKPHSWVIDAMRICLNKVK